MLTWGGLQAPCRAWFSLGHRYYLIHDEVNTGGVCSPVILQMNTVVLYSYNLKCYLQYFDGWNPSDLFFSERKETDPFSLQPTDPETYLLHQKTTTSPEKSKTDIYKGVCDASAKGPTEKTELFLHIRFTNSLEFSVLLILSKNVAFVEHTSFRSYIQWKLRKSTRPRLHSKSHSLLIYCRWKTICKHVWIYSICKTVGKSTGMTFYFCQESEVHIQWTRYYPLRPWDRISECSETKAMSHDSDSITNIV